MKFKEIKQGMMFLHENGELYAKTGCIAIRLSCENVGSPDSVTPGPYDTFEVMMQARVADIPEGGLFHLVGVNFFKVLVMLARPVRAGKGAIFVAGRVGNDELFSLSSDALTYQTETEKTIATNRKNIERAAAHTAPAKAKSPTTGQIFG